MRQTLYREPFARNDTSLMGRWWWTIDRWSLFSIFALMILGIILLLAASPPVAERIGVSSFHFVKRQLFLLPIGLAIFLGTTMLPPSKVKLSALCIVLISFVLMIVVLFLGVDIKGAKRWINMGGFSLQPSEFIKPSLAIIWGWLLSIELKNTPFPGKKIAFFLYVIAISLLILQPDLGMSIVLSGIWFVQLFLAGLSYIWILVMLMVAVLGILGAYLFLHRRAATPAAQSPALSR